MLQYPITLSLENSTRVLHTRTLSRHELSNVRRNTRKDLATLESVSSPSSSHSERCSTTPTVKSPPQRCSSLPRSKKQKAADSGGALPFGDSQYGEDGKAASKRKRGLEPSNRGLLMHRTTASTPKRARKDNVPCKAPNPNVPAPSPVDVAEMDEIVGTSFKIENDEESQCSGANRRYERSKWLKLPYCHPARKRFQKPEKRCTM